MGASAVSDDPKPQKEEVGLCRVLAARSSPGKPPKAARASGLGGMNVLDVQIPKLGLRFRPKTLREVTMA